MTTPSDQVHAPEPAPTERDQPPAVPRLSFLPTEARAALRLAAMTAAEHATTEVDLSQLWQGLTRGSLAIVDDFFSEEHCYLLLEFRSEASPPLAGRRLKILETVLSGLPQKNVASDLALAPSTVALNSRLALESLGVSSKPSRAHPLLMLAAKVARDGRPVRSRCANLVARDGRELQVVRALRPDRLLAQLLPAAELAVVRRLIEGRSYAEIAEERGTSTRTIANQITAVFRRLRASGRNELVQRLFLDDDLEQRSDTTGVFAAVKPAAGPGEWRGERRSA